MAAEINTNQSDSPISVFNIIKSKDIIDFTDYDFALKDFNAFEGEVRSRVIKNLDKEIISIIDNDFKKPEDDKDHVGAEIFYLMLAVFDVEASDMESNKKHYLKKFLNKIILEKFKYIKGI